jgi:phenylpropionate dioxygenase-like ring-hydroxylating dioxygenase large terminal subunit
MDGAKNPPAITVEDLAEPLIYSPEAYTSPDYAKAEADRLWAKVWQMACRVEEIPKVGDYLGYDIMDDSILIVRTAPDTIKAFYNVCSHRGRKLMDAPHGAHSPCGHAKRFACRFHGWRYDLEGNNVFVLDKENWQGALTEERTRLGEVKVETLGGWIWVNMDPDCIPLREYLEPSVGLLFDPFELEKMRYRWRQWVIFDCNWKVAQEAFTESHHVEGTHPQLIEYADFYTWSQARGLHTNHGFEERNPELSSAASNTLTRAGRGTDARRSIAALHKEIWDTVNASTTQTLVDAALRLMDELPEDTPAEQVTAHWFESARKADAARGVIWPEIDPEILAQSGVAWHIFPNLSVSQGVTFALCYRARPYGADPDKCIFEAFVLERFPEGQEPKTEWVYADPDDPKWLSVLPQDFSNMAAVQKGMKCRGFRGALPNPHQEQSISNMHRNLARYMGTGAPRKLD